MLDQMSKLAEAAENPTQSNSWKFNFVSWLSFGEPKYQPMLEHIEKLDKDPDMSTYSTEEKEFSVRLLSILASYLKGKCMSLVKSYNNERDGFKLWRFHQEYLPNTRGRSVALVQALSSYPSFAKDKTAMENILVCEHVVKSWRRFRPANILMS